MVLSTAAWAVWSLLLGRYTSEENVGFGVLLSGRSGALSIVETLVGQTLNVLPTRVNISRGKPVSDWLREIWDIQVELSRYEHTSQDKVREWWDIPPGGPLFESYLTVQNFPGVKESIGKSGRSSTGMNRRAHLYMAQMEYPLRLDLYPGTELCFIMHYYRRSFCDDSIKRMIDDFHSVLLELIENPDQTVEELMAVIDVSHDKKQLKVI